VTRHSIPSSSGGAARYRGRILLALLALLVAYLAYAGIQSYRHATALRVHADVLQGQALSNPGEVGDTLQSVRRELRGLRRDLGPLLWLAQGLGWVPRFGPTVAAAPDLLDAGALYVEVGIVAWDAAGEPLAQGIAQERGMDAVAPAVVRGIAEHRHDLASVVAHARHAADLIAAIDADRLLAPLGEPLAKVQGALPLVTAGIEALPLLPEVAPAEGTRTFLLLAQNNDELRATGGFISSIGTLTFRDAVPELGPMVDSYAVEDWTKPHPDPPEALRTHMGIDLWTTRDANWSPDFPTSARAVAELYALNQGVEAHGVIAVDMAAASRLLEVLTPLTLPDGTAVQRGQVMETIYRGWSLPDDALVTPGVVLTATHDFEAIEVALVYSRQTGQAWFDAVEVAALEQPANNLVTNPSFEHCTPGEVPPGWEGENLTVEDGWVADEAFDGERSFHMVGDLAADKVLRQRIAYAGGAGTALRVRVMSRTENTDWRAGPYMVVVRLLGAEGVVEEHPLRLPDLAYHWATAGSTEVLSKWLQDRKAIVQELVAAGAARLASGDVPWPAVAEEAVRLLEERHIQLYAADEEVQGLLARYGWDGALGEAAGDYLAVVDTNVGYNKVSASLQQAIHYEVTLAADGEAKSRLTLSYRNASTRAPGACDKFRAYVPSYELLTQGCYWGHVRVYVPAGAMLEGATGSDDGVGAGEEAGFTVFSASLFLQPGEERELSLHYSLPPSAVASDSYTLRVRKQAGTEAIPLVVEVLAPERLVVPEMEGLTVRDNRATLSADLRVDRRLSLRWR